MCFVYHSYPPPEFTRLKKKLRQVISTAPPSPSPGGLQDAPGFRISGSPFPRVPGQTESYRNAAPKPPASSFPAPEGREKGRVRLRRSRAVKLPEIACLFFFPGTFRMPAEGYGRVRSAVSPPPQWVPLPGSPLRQGGEDHSLFLKTRTGKKRTTGTGSCRLPGQHFQAGSFIRPFLYFFTLAAHYNPAAIPGSFRKRDAGGCCSCVRRHHRNAA